MQPFVVNISSLSSGVNTFSALANREFFDGFGNSEILDATVKVDMALRNRGSSIEASCTIEGSVVVSCDLCLEPLSIDVQTSFEETYYPEGNELDLSQDVYDYIITALPLRRVHPEGECNEETTKYISK